ncbi:hypothetical protein ACVV2G_01490 [Streptomyces ziwulingensis]
MRPPRLRAPARTATLPSGPTARGDSGAPEAGRRDDGGGRDAGRHDGGGHEAAGTG